MDQVIKMLVKQFADKGMKEDEISSCIGSIWSISTDPNVKCCEDLILEMRAIGWQNIELNDEAFKMVSTAFKI